MFRYSPAVIIKVYSDQPVSFFTAVFPGIEIEGRPDEVTVDIHTVFFGLQQITDMFTDIIDPILIIDILADLFICAIAIFRDIDRLFDIGGYSRQSII